MIIIKGGIADKNGVSFSSIPHSDKWTKKLVCGFNIVTCLRENKSIPDLMQQDLNYDEYTSIGATNDKRI